MIPTTSLSAPPSLALASSRLLLISSSICTDCLLRRTTTTTPRILSRRSFSAITYPPTNPASKTHYTPLQLTRTPRTHALNAHPQRRHFWSKIRSKATFSSVSRRASKEEADSGVAAGSGSSRYLDSHEAQRSATAAAAADGAANYTLPEGEPEVSGGHPIGLHGRALLPKHGGEVTLRCTEFDAEGNVRVVSGEYKKSELCTKHGLMPRDLRKLDSTVIVPHILVRRNSILVNLLHVRALIKSDSVLLFDVYGSTDSYVQSVLMYDLEGKLRQGNKCPNGTTTSSSNSSVSSNGGGLPYEFRALEAILISTTAALEDEMRVLQGLVVNLLQELEEDIDRDKLRNLLIYSKKLSTFEQKAKLIRDAIDEILESDEDLADMYLTEKAMGMERPVEEHSEVELLLEAYYKVCDEIVQISGNLVSNIRSTEEVVNIILDANRNSLMLLDLKVSIGTLGLGSGALIASLYGMNVTNFLEESPLAFAGISGFAFVFSAIICGIGLRTLYRTQRLSMWGEGGKGRKGWMSLSSSKKKEALVRPEVEVGVGGIHAAIAGYKPGGIGGVGSFPGGARMKVGKGGKK
ncbi:cora-domain-containing protein [Ascobolus immersus RN42]|uniref:Magnesium transporter n=1 Tax=Ascobolus immersus RN42 TaxID=1160509 RepID=A0A3N4IJC3_ASCIM|nr:cora-domain-containing protein [Ascobolus immersus RN42]